MGRFIAKWEATLQPTLFSVNYFPWCRKLRTETMRRIIGTVGEIDWGEWNKSLTMSQTWASYFYRFCIAGINNVITKQKTKDGKF